MQMKRGCLKEAVAMREICGRSGVELGGRGGEGRGGGAGRGSLHADCIMIEGTPRVF
jgi:hypothetical protein